MIYHQRKGNMNKKQKNLTLYQFTSALSTAIFLLAVIMLGVALSKSGQTNIFFHFSNWLSVLSHSLIFDSSSAWSVFAGTLFYLWMILYLTSLYFGATTFSSKGGNLYDSLFLIFMMIPVLGNIFAVLAQFNNKKNLFTEDKIDKEEIIKQETLKVNKEIKAAKKRNTTIKKKK